MSSERICPVCQAPVTEGAVLCVQCGHDFRTGGKVQADPAAAAGGHGERLRPGLAIAAAFAIVAGLVLYFVYGSQKEAKKVDAEPPPAHPSGKSQFTQDRLARQLRDEAKRKAPAPPPPAVRASIPDTMPVPEARLKEEEWAKRFGEARKSIDLAALKSDRRPGFALRLLNVMEGSAAERQGMAVGDRLAEINGKPTRGVDAMEEQYNDANNVIRIWSPSKGLRDVRFPKGHMGISYTEDWLPELTCAQGQEADPRWAEFLVVAARAYRTDAALAETALHYAYQAGYRGWLLPALMIATGGQAGKNDVALAYGYATYRMVPENARWPVLKVLYQAALLEARFEFARQLNDEFPELYLQSIDWNPAGLWKREQRLQPQDLAMLEGDTPELRKRTEQGPLDGKSLNRNADNLRGQLRTKGVAEYNIGADQFSTYSIGPHVKNPCLHLRFRLDQAGKEPVAPLPDCFDKNTMLVSLVDSSTGIDRTFAKIRIWTNGKLGILIDGYDGFWIEPFGAYKPGDYNDLTLLLNGPWAEAVLNGRRVFLALLPVEDRSMSAFIELSEVKAEILQMEFGNLAPERARAPEPSAQAASKPLVVPPRPAGEAGWFYDTLVKGYLEHGKRDVRWDADAVAALAGAASYWSEKNRSYDVLDILKATRRAVEAGCKDPLVLYMHGEMLMRWEYDAWVESGRAFTSAAAGLIEYSCHPLWKFAIQNKVIKYGLYTNQDNRHGGLRAMAPQVAGLLPTIFADPAVPRWFLREMVLDLLERDSCSKYDRTESEYKVFQPALSAADKKGDIALAYKGMHLINAAWDARGSGWASTVTDEGWKLFRERLEGAKAALEEATRLDTGNVQAPTMLLTVALGAGGEDVMAKAFTDAVKADSDYQKIYENKLYYLRPRWHGSWEEMYTFAKSVFETVKKNPQRNPDLALLMINLHCGFLEDSQLGAKNDMDEEAIEMEYWANPQVWEDLAPVFALLLKRKPDSPYYKSQFACWALKCEQWKLADALFRELGEDCSPRPFGNPERAWTARQKARLRAAAEK